jgi:rod shape-determining protein MreC
MGNLIKFFLKHYFTLLFLFLEIIAVSLLVRFSSFHGAKLFKMKHSIVGGISDRYNDFSKYLSLVDQNKELVQENARLYNELKRSKYSLKDESYIDSVWGNQYKFTPARVVNNSVNKQYNFITLNKGRAQGIKEDMGVIGPDGLVGIVTTVTQHFSSVLPILNRKSAPNARIKNSNYFGHINWPGVNAKEVILKDIPLHAEIIIGDTIETSGNSAIYPPGILIGVITDYEMVKGVNYDVIVKLSTDFHNLTQVMVVENLLKEEQYALEDSVRND